MGRSDRYRGAITSWPYRMNIARLVIAATTTLMVVIDTRPIIMPEASEYGTFVRYCKASRDSYTIPGISEESVGGLPSAGNMTISSRSGIAHSPQHGGKLTLDSSSGGFVYAFFPYVAFNASDPNMGSFDTAFDFVPTSTSGALGFIAIDPDSDDIYIDAPDSSSTASDANDLSATKKKLEARLASIVALASSRPISSLQSGVSHDSSGRSSSAYVCMIVNYTSGAESKTTTIEHVRGGDIAGEPGLFMFDYKASVMESPGKMRRKYVTAELQYVAPPQSDNCWPSESTFRDTMCPQRVAQLTVVTDSADLELDPLSSSVSVINPFPDLSHQHHLPVSRFVGFFAFNGGVFELQRWQFQTFARVFYPKYNNSMASSKSIDNVLAASSAGASSPSSSTMLLFQLFPLLSYSLHCYLVPSAACLWD